MTSKQRLFATILFIILFLIGLLGCTDHHYLDNQRLMGEPDQHADTDMQVTLSYEIVSVPPTSTKP